MKSDYFIKKIWNLLFKLSAWKLDILEFRNYQKCIHDQELLLFHYIRNPEF